MKTKRTGVIGILAIGFGTGCLLFAAGEPKQMVQVSNTQRFDFPSGGTLRVRNSIGLLTVEAWDRPEVELTTIKSTKVEVDTGGREKAMHGLERVHVAIERRGGELVITTDFPRLLVNAEIEYRFKAPANARIIDSHHDGNVNIDGLLGDIDVSVRQGEILLHLPEENRYAVHAKSDFGSVNSDFSEPEQRTWWVLGHRSLGENSAAPHKLNLKVRCGDIIILKTRVPKAPGPLIPVRSTEGL